MEEEEEGVVPTQTGVIVQLSEEPSSTGKGKGRAPRKRRKRRRPIGFQLGDDLGRLDDPVDD